MRCKWDIRTAKAPDINREAYTNAAVFLNRLKWYRNNLTWMQWKTLRGQALAGDVDGAEKGLVRIVRRWQETGRGD